MSKKGGQLRIGTRPKRVRAELVHQNQIIEWLDTPCRVLSAKQWGEKVTLWVQPLRAYAPDRILTYRADEEVTMLGRSFGPS